MDNVKCNTRTHIVYIHIYVLLGKFQKLKETGHNIVLYRFHMCAKNSTTIFPKQNLFGTSQFVDARGCLSFNNNI